MTHRFLHKGWHGHIEQLCSFIIPPTSVISLPVVYFSIVTSSELACELIFEGYKEGGRYRGHGLFHSWSWGRGEDRMPWREWIGGHQERNVGHILDPTEN